MKKITLDSLWRVIGCSDGRAQRGAYEQGQYDRDGIKHTTGQIIRDIPYSSGTAEQRRAADYLYKEAYND